MYYDCNATVVAALVTVADRVAELAVNVDEVDETHIKLPSESYVLK